MFALILSVASITKNSEIGTHTQEGNKIVPSKQSQSSLSISHATVSKFDVIPISGMLFKLFCLDNCKEILPSFAKSEHETNLFNFIFSPRLLGKFDCRYAFKRLYPALS